MRKILLTLLFIGFSLVSKADQLAYVTYKTAKDAKEFLEQFDQVIMYCGCCSGELPTLINVKSVEAKNTGYENYYQVYIKGVTSLGNEIEEGVDLAYVYVNMNGGWYCVGLQLDLECDPCIEQPAQFK